MCSRKQSRQVQYGKSIDLKINTITTFNHISSNNEFKDTNFTVLKPLDCQLCGIELHIECQVVISEQNALKDMLYNNIM